MRWSSLGHALLVEVVSQNHSPSQALLERDLTVVQCKTVLCLHKIDKCTLFVKKFSAMFLRKEGLAQLREQPSLFLRACGAHDLTAGNRHSRRAGADRGRLGVLPCSHHMTAELSSIQASSDYPHKQMSKVQCMDVVLSAKDRNTCASESSVVPQKTPRSQMEPRKQLSKTRNLARESPTTSAARVSRLSRAAC